MAQSSFLRQLREQLEQGGTTSGARDKPWQQQGGRHVPQDTLVCDIYDPSLLPTTSPASTTTPSDPLPALQRLSSSVLSILSPVLSAYLFHHSSFVLVPLLTPAPHLTASLYFGDCVDDELLVSSLLLQLSAKLPELCISLEDDGGYFLLAEVADALPDWMSSEERLMHRVWFHSGQLRVIDEQLSLRPPASRLHAVQLLVSDAQRGGQHIAVPQQLQAALVQRLADYPAGALQRNRHHVRCLLPLLAVRVLQADGSVVSGAVNAFYTRDMIDMRTANKMQTFLPPPPTTAAASLSPASPATPPPIPSSFSRIVLYRVRLTRLLYAQLSSQPFTLPRSLLAHPSLAPYSSVPPSSPLFASLSLSYKLLAGLEMYYHNLVRRRTRHQQSQQQHAQQQAKRKADRQAKRNAWQRRRPMSEQEVEAELRRGEGGEERRRRWVRYVDNLTRLGWFTGVKREVDDEKWRQRVMMGYAVFDEEEERREAAELQDKTEQTGLTLDEQRHLTVIDKVMEEARKANEQMLTAEVEQWVQWEELEADDSDDWLHVTKDGFERMMAEKEEAMKMPSSNNVDADAGKDEDDESDWEEDDDVDEEAQQQAQSIVAAMKGFLGTMSGYEGAEIPSTSTAQQPTAAESKASTAQSPVAKGKEEAKTAPKPDAADQASRQQQLIRVLECDDEKRMLSEVSRYERQYGEGSFDRDLMQSVGDIQLDDDDDIDNKSAQHSSPQQKGVEATAETKEAEHSEDDEDEEEADDDDDDNDELLFGGERGNMRDYLAAMSQQLSGAGLGKEFERAARGVQHEDEDEEAESGVDTDLNLLKNMIDSLSSQHGMAGPAGNLLSAMSVNTDMKADRKRGKAKTATSTKAR